MTKIHLLDESTANKIAAGEVVERPASVVKELVENALDAGSGKIEVEIMSGGVSFIRVMDDGAGMSAADAKLAVQRHATSKIRAVDDLSRLSTLGFRGEALPTIASVSKFSLLTRASGSEFATLVELRGGKLVDAREAGGALGTTVKVEDLFFNTPARKKFLKTPATESSHINEMIVKLALSHPDVAFKFINNNRLVLSTPGGGSLYDAIACVYGAPVGKELLPVELADEDIAVGGFLSKPSVLRSSRQWQTYLVNGRVIASRSIAKAVDNAYHSLLPKSGYPLAVLDIRVPAQSVDVNVHPQKSEVKFADEGRIFKAVYKAVLDAVRTPEPLADVAAPVKNLERRYAPVAFDLPAPQCAAKAAQQPREPRAAYAPPHLPVQTVGETVSFAAAREALHPERAAVEAPPEPPVPAPPGAEALEPLGQVDRCYIVARGADGLYIVDQHAAHERILYDRFARYAEAIPSQQLLVHLFLDFSAEECALLLQQQEALQALGFALEQSGPSSVRLKEVPADVPVGEAEPILREILESLQELHAPTAGEIRHACLAVTVCKAAIKAGDLLNLRQMQILLDELAATALPFTCPHGRPSIIKFENSALAKMFKRT